MMMRVEDVGEPPAPGFEGLLDRPRLGGIDDRAEVVFFIPDKVGVIVPEAGDEFDPKV
jgi:hypothetical protein